MNKNLLNVHHMNVRSLSGKVNDLKLYILNHKCDILAVTETWLDRRTKTSSVNIEGYRFLRRDRDSRGGGVGFYINNNLKFHLIESNSQIEQLWVSIKYKSFSIVCGVIYRPPLYDIKSFFDNLEISFANALMVSDVVCCLGDFNVDYIKKDTTNYNILHQFMTDYNLEQLIDSYTRITSTTSTLIDLILTTSLDVILGSGVNSCEISDHDAIYVKFRVPKQKSIFSYSRNLKGIDMDNLLNDLKLQHLDRVYNVPNIDEKVDLVNSALISVFDIHAPCRKIRLSKPPAPWLSPDLKELMSIRDKVKAKYKQTKSPDLWHEYKTLRNQVTLITRRQKKTYFNFLSKEKNSKKLWKQLKNINIGKTSDTITEIPNNLNNADLINEYFVKSIPIIDQDNKELLDFFENGGVQNVSLDDQFCFSTIEEEDVLNILNKISTCAAGHDGINIIMVKLCFPILKNPLINIVNSCLIANYFPKSWKSAVVKPVPKTSEVKDFKDLRPISILPIMSKILEHVMNRQMKEYAMRAEILPVHQSGFRAGHSCTTALLKVTDDLLGALDRGDVSVLVLLDYSKAFDCLNPEILISMLHYYGFSQGALALIKSYFTDRHQTVKVNHQISKSVQLTRGVPQGSIVGPLLFCLYTSRLSHVIKHSQIHTYADDTQIYYSFSKNNIELSINSINTDLQNLYEQSQKYNLILNPLKTKVLVFSSKNCYSEICQLVKLNINGVALEIVEEARNLGLIIDSKFTYNKHISTCIQKAYSALRQLYPHRSSLTPKIKADLCNSLVLSHFSHCSPVYSESLSAADLYRVQKVQNSCLRFIFGIKKYDHVTFTLQRLQWLNMKNRYIFNMINTIHNIITKEIPVYLFNKIQFRKDAHSVNIRHLSNISIPYHRLTLFKSSFSYCVSKYYPELPFSIRAARNVPFKSRVRLWLFKRQIV